MKKKLFQILMLLVAAVSVGAFVSCKDTNEDLYNELRTQVISRDASLQSALDQHTQDIAALLAKYNTLLTTVNAINSCTCNEAAMQAQINGLGTDVATLQGDVATLQGQVATLITDLAGLDIDDISGLRTALTALQTSLSGKADNADLAWLSAKYNAEIPIIQGIISNLQTALAGKVEQGTFDAIINGLNTQIQGIQSGLQALQNQNLIDKINTNKALQDGLETRIASLESTLTSLQAPDGTFADILQRLTAAEQAISNNKAWLDQQLEDITGDITAAQTTADNALALANTANTNAQLAWQNAQRVEGLANAAQAAADNAQSDATAAQQAAQAAQNAADLAYALAARAYETANQVNALAIKVATLEGQVGTNTNDEAIKALQQQTQSLSSQISENKDKLQEAINKVNNDLTTKVNDLQSEIQTKMGELKDAFQGKIDNLDGKLETKISEVTSKITELNNTLIQNAGLIEQNAKDIAQNAKDIQANATAIEKIKSDLQTIDTNLTLASEKANQAYQEAVSAKTKADDNERSISDLKATVDVNKANIETLQGSTNDLKEAVDDLKEKMAQVGANTTAIENLSAAVDGINDDLEALDEKYDELKGQLSDLRTELAEAKSECANNFREAKSYVDTEIATLTATVVQKITDELNNYYDKDDINKILEAYAKASDLNGVATVSELNSLKDELKNLASKDELSSILSQLNGLVSQEELNSLKEDLKDVASKSDLDNLKNEILAQLSGIATQNDLDRVKSELQSDISGLQGDLSNLSTDFYDKIIQLYKDMDAGDKAIDDKIYELAQQVAANTQHLEDIDKVLQTMHERFNDMDARFVNRETIMAWLQNLYKTLNAKIAAGGGAEINIQVLKDEIKDDLVELLPDIITNTLEGSEFNFITEDDLSDYAKKSDLDDYAKKSALTALEEALTELINGKADAEEFAKAVEDIAEQEARILALEEGTVKIGDYELDKQALKDAIADAIADANTKIGTIQDAVTAINGKIPTMENDIRDLKTGLQEAKDRLAAVEPKVEALTNDVAKIQSYLAQQVTGITIQGTTNPMFGTFSIPANIQSNVLVAYYGRPDNKIEFPTTDDASYVRKDEVLTDKDWEMIGGDDIAFTQKAKKVLINEGTNGKAYAGKVYVTVNPTSANVAGLKLDIINTQDEASLFKLTELKKSYDKLEFGYSRADNGFYEAEAYVEKKDLDDVERPFNEQAIKDLAKEAQNDLEQIVKNALAPGNTALDNLATKVYEVVRTLRLDRSGLKCPFKDINGNEQAVYSQYNLAATALKPLSLEWGKSFNYVTVPGYEKAEKMLKKLCDKLTGVVTSIEGNREISKLFRDLEGLNIKHVTLNELSDAYLAQFAVEINTSFTIDDVRYDLVLPVNVWVPVKYAKNLTIGGTRLNVEEAERVDLAYFDENIAVNEKNELFNKVKAQVTKPTVVITEDDATGGVTSVLVVPVNDQAGTIQGFTKFPLATPVDVVSGEIQFDGTGIAMVSGGSVVTAGYTQNVNIDQLNYSFLFSGKTFTYYKKVDFSDAIKDLWENQVGEAIGDVNDILDQLNELIEDALKLRELMVTYEGKYTNLVNNYFGTDGKLHDYLDKINSIIVNFVNGINWQLGPYIVADDVKGFKVLSVEKTMPTVMSKRDLKLYPTSKNMEIFCPFARKHVAVTNVFKGAASAQAGDADCLAKLKAANTGDMNKVIDGTQRMIEVNGMVSGYTYEVAYSVLDFEGNISTRKTYIKIK